METETEYTLVLTKPEAHQIIEYLGIEIESLRWDVEVTEGEERESWLGLLETVEDIRNLVGHAASRANDFTVVNLPDNLYGILYEALLYHDLDLEAQVHHTGAQA